MSYVIAAPEMIAAASSNVASIGTPYTDPNGGKLRRADRVDVGQSHSSLCVAQADFLKNYYRAVTTKIGTS